MKPPSFPFTSFTQEWRNDTYAAIDPSRPELSVAGKKVVVTGAGAGIGRETAKAFIMAGAQSIALIGRTGRTLHETKDMVKSEYPSVEITIHVVDVSSAEDVRRAATEIGPWDVFISNAGWANEVVPYEQLDPADFWKCFEVNVRGNFNIITRFMPTRNTNASFISTSSGSIVMPIPMGTGYGAYVSSKIAQAKLVECASTEYPDVHVVVLHPGVVETDMLEKSKITSFPIDSVKLPAHFAVWLCSPEASFTKGRNMWCNWDVDELKERANEISEDYYLLRTNMNGWPFPH